MGSIRTGLPVLGEGRNWVLNRLNSTDSSIFRGVSGVEEGLIYSKGCRHTLHGRTKPAPRLYSNAPPPVLRPTRGLADATLYAVGTWMGPSVAAPPKKVAPAQ